MAPLRHGQERALPMPRTFASSRTAANESGVVADRWPAGIAPPGTTRPIGLDEPTANLLNADVPLLEEHLEGVAEEGQAILRLAHIHYAVLRTLPVAQRQPWAFPAIVVKLRLCAREGPEPLALHQIGTDLPIFPLRMSLWLLALEIYAEPGPAYAEVARLSRPVCRQVRPVL